MSSTNDPIADALIRIKNGYLARKKQVELPYSKIILAICQLLRQEKYIGEVKEEVVQGKNGEYKKIVVELIYKDKTPMLTDVKRVSKPGLRVYKGKDELPRVLGGLGIAIVSTPKGVMTDRQARKEGVGGEVIAYVW